MHSLSDFISTLFCKIHIKVEYIVLIKNFLLVGKFYICKYVYLTCTKILSQGICPKQYNRLDHFLLD